VVHTLGERSGRASTEGRQHTDRLFRVASEDLIAPAFSLTYPGAGAHDLEACNTVPGSAAAVQQSLVDEASGKVDTCQVLRRTVASLVEYDPVLEPGHRIRGPMGARGFP